MSIYQRAAYALGPALRQAGKALDALGASIEGSTAASDKLLPATRILPHKSKSPSTEGIAFIAPTASVIGDVKLGSGASVWYGAVVRGDVNFIEIGNGTSIGDGAVVHVAKIAGDIPTIIGKNVNIGPKAVIHACTIEDGAQIGAGCTVLNGARLQKGCVLSPGSLAPPKAQIPAGELWAGAPATFVRKISALEAEAIAATSQERLELSRVHARECDKDYKQVLYESELAEDKRLRADDYYQPVPLVNGKVPDDQAAVGDAGLTPGRIFNNALRRDDQSMDEWLETPSRPGPAGGEKASASN